MKLRNPSKCRKTKNKTDKPAKRTVKTQDAAGHAKVNGELDRLFKPNKDVWLNLDSLL